MLWDCFKVLIWENTQKCLFISLLDSKSLFNLQVSCGLVKPEPFSLTVRTNHLFKRLPHWFSTRLRLRFYMGKTFSIHVLFLRLWFLLLNNCNLLYFKYYFHSFSQRLVNEIVKRRKIAYDEKIIMRFFLFYCF